MIPIFADQSQNMAPLKPMLQLRDRKAPSHYITDALKERFKHYTKQNEAERKEIIASAQELSLIMQGNHYLTFNPYTNSWRAMKPKVMTADTMRGLNLTQYFVTSWLSKWEQSQPDVLIKAAFEDEKAIAAAMAADALYDRYERKFYNAFHSQQQGLQCFVFGNYLTRVRHNQDAKGNVVYRELFEEREVQLDEGYGRCACGYEGAASEFSQIDEAGFPAEACPKCGSNMVAVTPPITDIVPVPAGQEKVSFGDIDIEPLLFPGSYWEFSKQAHESSYFIYRQNIQAGKIRALLGDIQIPGEPDMSDFGLKILKSLANSGSPVSGRGAHGRNSDPSSWRDEVTMDELWLEPDEYRDIKLKGDEETLSGVPLPKGASLADIFPEKLCVVGLNGMSLITGLYAESHKDYLASGICHMKVGSGVGRNGSDVIEPQKRFNKFDNQAITAFDAFGSPGMIYAKEAIDEDHVNALGKANTAVPFDLARFPGLGLNNLVMPVQPATVSPQMMQYGEVFLKNAMQYTTHIMEFINGMPDVDVNTKGGQELASSISNSIFGPVLRVKGQCALRLAELTVKLAVKKLPPAVIARLLGRDGESRTQALFGIDIDEALEFSIQRDSEAPRSTYTKRQEYIAFFEGIGALGGFDVAMAKFPTLVQQTAELYNVRLDASNPADIGMRCRIRLEQMRANLAAGVIDPMQLVMMLQPPISLAEPYHQQKMQWWSEWLDWDEAWQPESLPLRTAAEQIIQQHFMAMGMVTSAAATQAGQVHAEATAAANAEQPQESSGSSA